MVPKFVQPITACSNLKTGLNQSCFFQFSINIVVVWSQYDGGNIEQRTIGYGCGKTKEAKLKIVGGVYLDPTNKILIQPFTI